MKLLKQFSILCFVLFLTIESSQCHLENDDVCPVPSSVDCDKNDDVIECKHKTADASIDLNKSSDEKIPPSWVNYLHNYEESKLNSLKSCKGEVLLEGVSLHCNYAKTIRNDLQIFNKIRQALVFYKV